MLRGFTLAILGLLTCLSVKELAYAHLQKVFTQHQKATAFGACFKEKKQGLRGLAGFEKQPPGTIFLIAKSPFKDGRRKVGLRSICVLAHDGSCQETFMVKKSLLAPARGRIEATECPLKRRHFESEEDPPPSH